MARFARNIPTNAPKYAVKTLEEVEELTKLGNAIPIYREMPADLETPITALLKLRRGAEHVFLLESVEGGERIARYSFLGKTPLLTFRSKGHSIHIEGMENAEFTGDPLTELKKQFARFRGVPDENLPNFAGGGVGFVAYDAVRLVENIPDTGEDSFRLDDIHIGIFDTFLVFDNLRHRMYLVSVVLPEIYSGLENAYKVAVNGIRRLGEELAAPTPSLDSKGGPPPQWTSNLTREEHARGVEACREYIHAGDAFQIVFSQRFETRLDMDALQIYRALRTINPSPYMYYLRFGKLEIVGASPEMLVKVNRGRVETRPIAGTRRRGRTPEDDAAMEADLMGDEKERAEHVMLVDLGRNDLGRVCEIGSVRVGEFMQVERYSHLMHIVSSVEGRLKPGLRCLDALMACFPAGTLSGAPKIRAMEIIDELEPHRRGVYGGAICYLDFNGNLDSCIAIRTLVVQSGRAYLQAGGGIVADSRPDLEYKETRNKAAALIRAVEVAGEL